MNYSSTKLVGCTARLATLAGAVFAGLVTVPAHGALTLLLSEPGFASVPITASPGSNTVSYFSPYGDFTTDIVVGFSNSNTPGSTAQLQIQSLDVTSNSISGPKTLTITLTDTGFTFPGTLGQGLSMTSSLGGTLTPPIAGDTITFSSTATPSVGPAASSGPQTYTVATSAPGTTSFNVPTTSSPFIETGAYTLSDQIVETVSGANKSINLSGSTTVTTAVPEPIGMSIIAIAGGAMLRRRRSA